jgi:predicted transcriptional regulator
MKAIIGVAHKGSIFSSVAKQFVASRKGVSPDFHLSFESANTLFSELTPARLDLLDTLRRAGPCSVYAFAKIAERNYSIIQTDVARLEELGLIEKSDEGSVSVLFESVEMLPPIV